LLLSLSKFDLTSYAIFIQVISYRDFLLNFHNERGIELMDIKEITENMTQTMEKMTQKEKFDLFLSAKIIDKDGYYHPDFFSESTVKADREAKTAFRKQ